MFYFIYSLFANFSSPINNNLCYVFARSLNTFESTSLGSEANFLLHHFSREPSFISILSVSILQPYSSLCYP